MPRSLNARVPRAAPDAICFRTSAARGPPPAAIGGGRDGVHQEHHPARRARRAHGLAGFGECGQRTTGTAVLGRDDEPERPDLAEGAEVLIREGALAIDARRLPRDALLGGVTYRAEQGLNVVVHGNHPFGQ